MGLTTAQIKFYKSLTNNDTTGNGGRISAIQIITGVLNNLFPNITASERTSGLTRYRKMFIRNENTEEISMENTYIWISSKSPADDYFRIKAGTDTDIQSAASGYTNWAGAGVLDVNASKDDLSIDVEYDVANGVYNGSLIYIDDGTYSEVATVNGAPSWAGNVATLSLAVGLGRGYTAGVTKVGTMLLLSNLETSYSNWVETSGSGTYNESSYPPDLYNLGTISETWTLIFTSSSAFTCSGANVGTIGGGTIGSNYAPVNGSSCYFRIRSAGWGGSWQAGDTITFKTKHAGAGIWVKEVVPSAIDSYSNNIVGLSWRGEAAP